MDRERLACAMIMFGKLPFSLEYRFKIRALRWRWAVSCRRTFWAVLGMHERHIA